MKECLLDRKRLTKKVENRKIDGNYTPFFCISYLEHFCGKYAFAQITQCHDVAAKSSVLDYNGVWIFHILNYFDENPQERIDIFLSLFRKTQSIHKLVEPKFTIINDINIKVECNTKEYEKPYKRLFLLKLFRFSYFYHGETIGQLFLNQRYYKTSQENEQMYSSREAQKISFNPSSWLYSLLSFNNDDNQFLDSQVNKKEYEKHAIYSSIRNFTEEPLQFPETPIKSTIHINTGNKRF